MVILETRNNEALLDELYGYTQMEYNDEKLSESQKERYMAIISFCHDNNVEIYFEVIY